MHPANRHRIYLFVRPLALMALALLGACAAAPQPKRDLPAAPVAAPAPLPVVAAPPAPFEYENDPYYRLLLAEFAGQRGHLAVAVENYVALALEMRDAGLAQRATRIAVFARDDKAALTAAKVWVELEPEDMDARQILAAMYVRQGDAAAALPHLEYVLAHDSGEAGSRLRMIASLLGREEDRATALDVMTTLIDKAGDDTDALQAYALLAIRAEKLERARDAMSRIARKGELDSNVVMAYLAVLQKQDKLPEALTWLEGMLAKNPDQFGLRLIYARLLADEDRYEEARLQFTLLAKGEPDNTDIIFALGLLNLQANRADDAVANFQQLIALDTRVDEAHYYLGQVEEARKKPDAAIKHYRAVEGGNNYFAAQLRTALVMSSQGKVTDASRFLDNVTLDRDEQVFELARAKGEILTEHGRLTEAMATYDKALEGDLYHSDLLYTRAMLAEKMGRIEVLERDLRTIIEREPENAQALNALGYTLADRTDRHEEALTLIKKALSLSPNDFYILDSMGWALYRVGRLDEAADYLKRARELRNDPEVAAHLGEVLWVMGDRDGARDVWDTALKDTPNDQRLLDVIKRLTP